jgi:hypothetical protein
MMNLLKVNYLKFKTSFLELPGTILVRDVQELKNLVDPINLIDQKNGLKSPRKRNDPLRKRAPPGPPGPGSKVSK